MSCRFLSPNKAASDRPHGHPEDSVCFVSGKKPEGGFTLVEILVGTAVLLLLLVMLFSMTSQTTSIVSVASARVDAFQSARGAFDTISQRISQATMNNYWDYYNSSNQRRDPVASSGTGSANFTPANYGRASDLHFLITSNTSATYNYGQALYFAAPEGVSGDLTKDQAAGLLNAFGYKVQYGDDAAYTPSMVNKHRYRYRLMQAVQPAENLLIYSSTNSTWVTGTSATTGVQSSFWPMADNIIALVVWPRQPMEQDTTGTNITPNYTYDSRAMTSAVSGSFPIQYAQAPPAVQVTMIAIDEASAQRFDTSSATEPGVIKNALQGKFVTSSTSAYQSDINSIQTALAAQRIHYLILSTWINLRESKWTGQ